MGQLFLSWSDKDLFLLFTFLTYPKKTSYISSKSVNNKIWIHQHWTDLAIYFTDFLPFYSLRGEGVRDRGTGGGEAPPRVGVARLGVGVGVARLGAGWRLEPGRDRGQECLVTQEMVSEISSLQMFVSDVSLTLLYKALRHRSGLTLHSPW